MRKQTKESRALRRHHNARLRKVRGKYHRGWVAEASRQGYLLNTACNCSCWMCGNPRKYSGDLTLQELSDLEAFSKHELKE